ncbi:hypothetical protein BGP_6625 [Beggiatoa sp. PS]|nr:hypothetical protein BGP_6625 [Beggiatoa sp. PS]
MKNWELGTGQKFILGAKSIVWRSPKFILDDLLHTFM